MTDSTNPSPVVDTDAVGKRHMKFGWWAVFLFMTLGLALEALNGFKLSWYVAVTNEARRLTLRLAHAHGTLFGLINVAFALSVARLGLDEKGLRVVSALLRGGTVLLPGGFVVGAVAVYGGDPGLGVGLVPIGAVLMIVGVLLVARAASRRSRAP